MLASQNRGSGLLSSHSGKPMRGAVVLLDDGGEVHGEDLPVADDGSAMDDGVTGAIRGREEDGGDGIAEGAGVGDVAEVDSEEIGTGTGAEGANVGAAEDGGTAESGDLQRFAGGHPFGGAAGIAGEEIGVGSFRRSQAHLEAGEQHRHASLEEHVVAIVACGAVDAKADLDASVAVFANRRDT